MTAPIWAALPVAARRFSVGEVRRLCALFPPPGSHEAGRMTSPPRPAAALVPVVDVDGEAAVVVTKRHAAMTYHRGDWVFPGGRFDPEKDGAPVDAARREAEEELGLPAGRVGVTGQLDTQGPISTGFVIEVFVGVIDGPVAFDPDPTEVEEAVALSFSYLMAPGVYSASGPMPEHEAGPRADGFSFRSEGEAFTSNQHLDGQLLHQFTVRPGEYLWGTQGNIVVNLLQHLIDARAGLAGLAETPGSPC